MRTRAWDVRWISWQQEMNREANTILSKSNDLIVSNAAIDLKTEIEDPRADPEYRVTGQETGCTQTERESVNGRNYM